MLVIGFLRIQHRSDLRLGCLRHPTWTQDEIRTTPINRSRSLWPISTSLVFLLLAMVIISRTPQPLDVGRELAKPYAPHYLAGTYGQPVALLAKERAYFEQFGGAAIKMQYAERGLLITRTESPLRHLHAPDECLRGLGFEVDYLGSHDKQLPTAVYRAVSPDGAEWKVSVSFISGNGATASNVAEAVWQWLQRPQPWMAIQRISPWNSSSEADNDWDRKLFAALDLLPSTHPAAAKTVAAIVPTAHIPQN
jgi:hypothetical protein